MKNVSRLLLTVCAPFLVAGCATAPAPVLQGEKVFNDAVFGPPSEPIGAEQLFAISPTMRAYLRSPEFLTQAQRKGVERGLIDALYQKGQLKLEYDASITRNAAETFDARMGNCLSLVVMTAAFAKELGVGVRFHDVVSKDVWSRNAGMYVASTHINLSLVSTPRGRKDALTERLLTVDFVAPTNGTNNSYPLDETEIRAMYLNNRAAEALAQNKVDDAYWWARAAIAQRPQFTAAHNTLGVVYIRHGNPDLAERVFKATLAIDPKHTISMHNLVPVLSKLGKHAEAVVYKERLEALEPVAPYFWFEQGSKAMAKGQYAEAKKLFAKEIRREPFNHEFHFWLAQAHLRLGESKEALEQMALAVDTSSTHDNTKRYSAKLAYLRSLNNARAN